MYQKNKSNYDMPFCGLSLRMYETGKKAPSYEYHASSTKSKFQCSLTKKLYGISEVMTWYKTPEVQKYVQAGYSLKWGSKVQQAKETKYGADTEQVITLYMVKPRVATQNVDGLKPISQTMPQHATQFAPENATPVEQDDMDDEIPF